MTAPRPRRRSAIAGVTLVAATLPLAACGGSGGGVQSTPVPPQVAPPPAPPAPSPPPAPPPAPAPSAFSQTEYEKSNGPLSINAAAAYRAGATGAGVIVGIVDSGIDQSQIEFAGRISPLSRDFAGNNTVQDEGAHGTEVAGVLAAAANDRNTLGVAFNSTILALRTDRPGSCADTSDKGGCKHPDPAIAAAIDFAADNGAKVINISLGGASTGFEVRQAIGRATSRGVIIVISAGNDGEETKGTNPDPFAQVASEAISNGLVIIAGALSEDNTSIAGFSSRAGQFKQFYLTALGQRVRTVDNQNQAVLASGTSFAAPVISGAIALIRQAFPNMTAAQVVDLVYRTARDLGAPGTDEVFGHGGLDLTRAFQPQGTMTLAGSTVVLGSLSAARLGSAMGDGGRITGVNAVALDDYGRAFDTPVLSGARAAAAQQPFAAALRAGGTQAAGLRTSAGGLLAVSVDGVTGAQPLALRQVDAIAARTAALAFVQRLSPRTAVSLGIARGAEGLTQRLDDAREGAFLLAGRADGQVGLMRDADTGVAVAHDLGSTRLTLSAETGRALTAASRLLPGAGRGWDRSGYSLARAGAERPIGPAMLSVAAAAMAEDATVLGARLGPALGGGRGADSWFVDAGGALTLGEGWRTAAQYRRGWTSPRAGGALTGGVLASDAWSFDLAKSGVVGDDQLSLRLSQPLRVTGGGLRLSLPDGYDYATLATSYRTDVLNLSPLGAERAAELSYARSLWGGALSVNGFWRGDPGNDARRADETGALLRWSAGF